MKILVVVDMQNDFIDGALGSPEARAIVPKVIQKINSYKGTDTTVIYTRDTHNGNYLLTQEGMKLPVSHCIFGTWGWYIAPEVLACGQFSESGCVFNKNTFGSTALMNRIDEESLDIEEIIFIGLCTDICVITNAILAKTAAPEALITVDASCCAGVTPESHKNALEAMKMLQINVINEGE